MTIYGTLEITIDLPFEGSESWMYPFMISLFIALSAVTFENKNSSPKRTGRKKIPQTMPTQEKSIIRVSHVKVPQTMRHNSQMAEQTI